MVLLPLVALMAVGGWWLWREMCKVPEEHALAGWFGVPAREAELGRRAGAVLAEAEGILRIERFSAVLRDRAWTGTPLSVRRLSRRWSLWSFADGADFVVLHGGRLPRHLRRLVVADVEPVSHGVAVAAYAPVNGPGVALTVMDVQDVDRVLAS